MKFGLRSTVIRSNYGCVFNITLVEHRLVYCFSGFFAFFAYIEIVLLFRKEMVCLAIQAENAINFFSFAAFNNSRSKKLNKFWGDILTPTN